MTSPLFFAQNFIQFKSQLLLLPSVDLKLLHLNEYWFELKTILDKNAYSSYVDEYKQLLVRFISESSLQDLKLQELKQLYTIADKLSLKVCEIIIKQLITLNCYVGKIEDALNLYAQFYSQKSESVEILIPEDISTIESLKLLCLQLKDMNQEPHQYFQEIYDKWELLSESLSHSAINCLFVLKNENGNNHRGRLEILESSVELFGKNIKNDEVTFENQIRTPDDPFVGVLYNSLKSVRQIFCLQNHKEQRSRFYHSHFSIADSQSAFTGDSIGLAASVATYTQLLKTELLRHERFISGDVAFTGSIDDKGNILAVNDNTIEEKIHRAFFSHLKYVVLPEENLKKARSTVDVLNKKYPKRHLHLVSMSSLSDVIDDKNIIRSEKVCIGEYAAKTVYKYSKMTKLHVPLLIGLAYLLVCIIYPKAWVGFDYHIANVEIIGNKFRTLNANNQTIWWSKKFDYEMDPIIADGVNYSERFFISLEHKGEQQLLAIPQFKTTEHQTPYCFYFDNNGHIIDSFYILELTNYDLQEKTFAQTFDINEAIPIYKENDLQYFVLSYASSMPARNHLYCIDLVGNKISGPYINTGHPYGRYHSSLFDITNDGIKEILFTGYNNRSQKAILAVLNPLNLKGISPPFDNELFINSKMPKGSQLYYVEFPKTELTQIDGLNNYACYVDCNIETNSYNVTVLEGRGLPIVGVNNFKSEFEQLATVGYELDSNFIPINVYIADGAQKKYFDLLESRKKEPIKFNYFELIDYLTENIKVYHDSTLVHHPAQGIYFYQK